MSVKIVCDFCDTDLSQTGNMPAYRLHLHAEKIPQPNGTYCVRVFPPIEEEVIFCSIEHLHNWLATKINSGI